VCACLNSQGAPELHVGLTCNSASELRGVQSTAGDDRQWWKGQRAGVLLLSAHLFAHVLQSCQPWHDMTALELGWVCCGCSSRLAQACTQHNVRTGRCVLYATGLGVSACVWCAGPCKPLTVCRLLTARTTHAHAHMHSRCSRGLQMLWFCIYCTWWGRLGTCAVLLIATRFCAVVWRACGCELCCCSTTGSRCTGCDANTSCCPDGTKLKWVYPVTGCTLFVHVLQFCVPVVVCVPLWGHVCHLCLWLPPESCSYNSWPVGTEVRRRGPF
jgi:hypothetical protein